MDKICFYNFFLLCEIVNKILSSTTNDFKNKSEILKSSWKRITQKGQYAHEQYRNFSVEKKKSS